MNFTNEQIDIETIPKLTSVIFQSLEKKYFSVLIYRRLLMTLLLSILVIAHYVVRPFDIPYFIYPLSVGLLLLFTILGFTATIMGFKHKAYALREKDIIYQSGWLWKEMTTAPFNRVQHVRIDQGPIERQFNLSKLIIFTAGGNSSDVTIPGIHPDTANDIKEFIVNKTIEDEEE